MSMTKMKANDPCWCGSGKKFKRCHKEAIDAVRPGVISPMRPVPEEIARPEYVTLGYVRHHPEPLVKSADVIERMRRAGMEAADVLHTVGAAIVPGMTTDEIDEMAHEMAIAKGAYPSPLGYGGPDNPYPKSLCTSVNEVVCHGIPDSRALRDGDIVNLDVTLYLDGVHGDTNATFAVGQIDQASRRLIDVTRECTDLGIGAVRPGRPISDIGRAIEDHATAHGYGVIRDFVGHGIGEQFHTDLHIPHYYTSAADTVMEPGMTFTIEPMISMGTWRQVMWDDGWTSVTADLRRTAQFEHTLLVTDGGVEILTPPPS
ncbi:MAG TPA: type I methionyl aminopeptidase [Acidimicrobiales bacterium]|nr:type I methionyl aminopeptidase [Acidimicrobiales bacterium]